MNILKTSKELSAREVYNLTMNPETRKMKDFVGSEIEIAAWAIYEDVDKKTGEVHNILSILTPDGEVIGTNSATFMDELERMTELFSQYGEEVHAVEVIGGKSKNDRDYITCKYSR